MNFFIFSAILSIATSLSTQLLHQEVNNAMDDLTPPDVKKSIDDFRSLVDKGEVARARAIANRTRREIIYKGAFADWKKAHAEYQTALGNQRQAEEIEAGAFRARDAAIKFRDQKIREKDAADALVPPAKAWMDAEIARVAEENVALQKVKVILEGLIKDGSLAQESAHLGRSLLGLGRRTVTLLTAPSFIASLSKADPARVQQVLDIVLNLIQEGVAAQQDATDKYNARVAEAKTAADNLTEAIRQLSLREQELADATAHKKEMIRVAKEHAAHEADMRAIRDEMKVLLEIQIDFTAREIIRIDGEKAILLEAINLQTQLHKVTQLLA